MIFQEDSIKKILNKTKCQTRRLVKEGDSTYYMGTDKQPESLGVFSKSGTLKWRIENSYVVQSGRGKPGVWYCANCKIQIKKVDATVSCKCAGIDAPCVFNDTYKSWQDKAKALKIDQWKPLRITITGIRKERLLDISEADAKKEGFENRLQFLNTFYSLSKKFIPKYVGGSEVIECEKEDYIKISQEYGWNPEVWAIDFCVVKGKE